MALSISSLYLINVYAHSQNREKRLLPSSCLSIRLSAWNKSLRTGRIFMKFDISIFRKSVEKIEVSLKSDRE